MPFDGRRAGRSWPASLRFFLFMAILSIGGLNVARAQDGPPGITQRTVFPAFDPGAPACTPPTGLNKVLAHIQENDRDFLQGVDHGLAMAASDRGLKYRRLLIQNDTAKAIEQIRSLLADKAGALVATSSDPAAISHDLQKMIWSGAFVGTIVPPPATLLLNAPQYATGKVLTDAAIAHINAKLGGKANVVLLTQDSMEFLAPRFEVMRDGFNAMPGVTIVADIAPKPVTKEGGFETMKTILLANPKIDVVLGSDAVVTGALKALRAAGKDRPDQFLGGIDGEPEAVAEITKGDSPYKASISLSSPVFGYAMGQFAADWLEGKSIPQAMDILPIALTSNNIAQYEADLANPAPVYADPARRNGYLKMYGNICYDTRDRYVNFPWSSERK
ncbi:sugar ABC transporter substrate-binding protein [Mesorhizobium erdmanii]|uniref:Sugar ABC transporter substrate-binding protein n=1 Tax=Mesorhizobium erdmanii TaxID=1777866 RepID=A0A6M7UF88_9HYPH|nr:MULTISPECIES: sugar ABC transporter substrate-binding protein [Mesorhizobium]OBQ70977.1 ribose ABC transporter [Mesorhizobium loti]QKC76599.1 sugar ABC transporter substrate-binding protein [Mesorhizobium erdmanii]